MVPADGSESAEVHEHSGCGLDRLREGNRAGLPWRGRRIEDPGRDSSIADLVGNLRGSNMLEATGSGRRAGRHEEGPRRSARWSSALKASVSRIALEVPARGWSE